MPVISDEAIVLRRIEYAETSQVLAFFTRGHGKVRIIAKGARRSSKTRFNPGIDLLDIGRVSFSVRHVGQDALATLTEWKPTRSLVGLRARLSSWLAGQYAADVLAGLSDDWDAHAALYDASVGLLERLSIETDEGDLLALVRFQRAVCLELGHWPRFDACVSCDRPIPGGGGRGQGFGGGVYFSSFDGGLLCRDCEPAHVEKRELKIDPARLRTGSYSTPADVAGAFDVLDYHLSHLMGRKPAASGELTRILASEPDGAR